MIFRGKLPTIAIAYRARTPIKYKQVNIFLHDCEGIAVVQAAIILG